MSKIKIRCRHCGQMVKKENTQFGCCFKARDGRVYLDCHRYVGVGR